MDMTNNYKSLSFLFPDAKIITDRYHYIRQVYWALDTFMLPKPQKSERMEEEEHIFKTDVMLGENLKSYVKRVYFIVERIG